MTELLKYVEILSANLSAVDLVKDLKEYENMEDFSKAFQFKLSSFLLTEVLSRAGYLSGPTSGRHHIISSSSSVYFGVRRLTLSHPQREGYEREAYESGWSSYERPAPMPAAALLWRGSGC